MISFAKVVSTEFNKVKNLVVKFARYGKLDARTAEDVSSYGIDSNPVKDMVAIYAESGVSGETVIIGYINKNRLAQVGETRLFSTDANGNLKTSIWLKNDGNIELGGNTDNLLRFSKTKEVLDELKNDITTLKNIFKTWTPVPNDGGAALKTASTTWANTALQKSIDPAKIDTLKTP